MAQPTDLATIGLSPTRVHVFSITDKARLDPDIVLRSDQILHSRDTKELICGDGKTALSSLASIGGGVGSSGIIAATAYSPPSDLVTQSAAHIDTGASVTFIAPSTGKVLIQAAPLIYSDQNTATGLSANLRTGAGDVAGTERGFAFTLVAQFYSPNLMWQLSALTPGQSYTYKLGVARTSGTTSSLKIFTGAIISMIVTALP